MLRISLEKQQGSATLALISKGETSVLQKPNAGTNVISIRRELTSDYKHAPDHTAAQHRKLGARELASCFSINSCR